MKIDPIHMMEEKCEVRNLSCVAFPTMKQCQGIAMGGCACKYSSKIISFDIFNNSKFIFKLIHKL